MSDPSTDSTKRRLPRFSFITLLVAVNVAGYLVWLNFLHPDGGGWPLLAHLVNRAGFLQFADRPVTNYSNLTINIIIGSSIVLAMAICTEFIVRKFRKAKRNDA